MADMLGSSSPPVAPDKVAVVPAPVAVSPLPSPSKTRFRIDERYIAPALITCILLVAHASAGILKSPTRTLLAIGTSIFVELVLGYLFTKKWPHWASAYISGISVGILIQSTELWPYALCSAIAIASKYVIRINGKHLWNPSNFAICAMLLLAPDSVATLGVEFDNRIWAMLVIWALGSVIIYRLKRFHICLTYAISFIAFAFLRSLMPHHNFLAEVSPITGPMYQLFIFFMITDPKTTMRTKKAQMVVAFLVAFAENILRMMGNVHAPYFALTIVGPAAMVYQIWLDKQAKLSGLTARETR